MRDIDRFISTLAHYRSKLNSIACQARRASQLLGEIEERDPWVRGEYVDVGMFKYQRSAFAHAEQARAVWAEAKHFIEKDLDLLDQRAAELDALLMAEAVEEPVE